MGTAAPVARTVWHHVATSQRVTVEHVSDTTVFFEVPGGEIAFLARATFTERYRPET